MSTANLSPDMPADILELRAAEQRRRLHNSVEELKFHLHDRLDAKKAARQYMGPLSGAVAVAGLLLGYGLAGIFTG